MTIIIAGETHIHSDRISLADGHMIECPSKIVVGPNFVWGFCGYAPSPKMEAASAIDELVAAYEEEADLRMGNGDQILLSHGVTCGTVGTVRKKREVSFDSRSCWQCHRIVYD